MKIIKGSLKIYNMADFAIVTFVGGQVPVALRNRGNKGRIRIGSKRNVKLVFVFC